MLVTPRSSSSPGSRFVTVDIISAPGGKSKEATQAGNTAVKSAHRPVNEKVLQQLHLGDLVVGKDFRFNSEISQNESGLGKKQGTQIENGFALAEGMDLGTESKLYPFFHGLWKKIDNSLGFPTDFEKARVQGFVQLQFEVDKTGMMTGRIFQLDSTSKHLKAYILAILVHALKNPLPKQIWNKIGKMIIVARFDFDIFTTDGDTDPVKGNHLKNVLSFKRSAYAKPKLNEYIDKFYERYMPPIVLIPGGLYFDFYRAYEMIEAIGKSDPDDLRDERLQLMLEEWDRVVRKENSNGQ